MKPKYFEQLKIDEILLIHFLSSKKRYRRIMVVCSILLGTSSKRPRQFTQRVRKHSIQNEYRSQSCKFIFVKCPKLRWFLHEQRDTFSLIWKAENSLFLVPDFPTLFALETTAAMELASRTRNVLKEAEPPLDLAP